MRDFCLDVLDAAASDGVKVSTGSLPTGQLCPGLPAEWNNVNWLGNLESAGTGGRIDKKCLEMDPPGVVGARVEIDTGELRGLMPTNQGYSSVLWELKTHGGAAVGGKRVILDSAQAELEVKSTVTLRLRPFESFPAPKDYEIKIELQLPPGAKAIEVHLANHASTEPALSTVPIAVHHFASYYDLLPGPQPVRPFPHPAKEVCIQGKEMKVTAATHDTGFCPAGLVFTPDGN